jgi:hypothetical protein
VTRAAGLLAVCLALLCPPAVGAADGEGAALKASACAAIARDVDAAAKSGPVFVASYPTADVPALQGTAFVYDNALAVIALIACGDTGRAARVGAALRIAAGHDRFWHDGRIRNAYRTGPVSADVAPALPGWWDTAAARWDEDPYQVGTATGNVAWAALALIALDRARPDPADRAAASGLMRWVARTTAVAMPVAGYAGGFYGEEPHPQRLAWESTEHNVDVAAAFGLLGDAAPGFGADAARARGFVVAMWNKDGRFWLGTDAEGTAINRHGAAIDAELWPLIGISDPPAAWQAVRAGVRAHLRIDGGYGFHDHPDGIWTEGTAQAALVLHEPGVFAVLKAAEAPDGLLYASPQARIHTGLALSPSSTTDDFYYFHLPHLGATAWAVLAATGTNPFAPQ